MSEIIPKNLEFNELVKEYEILKENFQRIVVEKENLILENNDLNSINEGLSFEKQELENRINNIIDNLSNQSQNSDEVSSEEENTSLFDKLISQDNFKKIKIELLDDIISTFLDIINLLKSLNKRILEFQKKINNRNQDEDDIIFYNSIILDCKNYFISSFRVRESKFINDMNKLFKLLEPGMFVNILKVDRTLVSKFKISYGKIIRDNKESKANKNGVWIKNNKLKSVDYINKEVNRCFTYHNDISKHFKDSLEKEVKFFEIK